MNKIKKRYIVIFSLLLLLVISCTIIIIYLPKKPFISQTVDVFGAPRVQINQNFPIGNPKFTAIIGKINPASVRQQSIKVYQIGDPKKAIVFERPFYADGFRGNELTYTLSSSSAAITQNGSLGTIGCKSTDCTLVWSNFYTWDGSSHTFVLDNVNHKNDFQQLLTTYQTLDTKGCTIVNGDLLPNQEGISFTEIYKKFPTALYYCSKDQGILPANLVFFLQAKKTLEEIVSGENIGSSDIRNITL